MVRRVIEIVIIIIFRKISGAACRIIVGMKHRPAADWGRLDHQGRWDCLEIHQPLDLTRW
jgi:hypothetical protein